MDIVTDLSSQAVSILTLLQDILKDNEVVPGVLKSTEYEKLVHASIRAARGVPFEAAKSEIHPASRLEVDNKRLDRIKEIFICTLPYETASDTLTKVFLEVSDQLLNWLNRPNVKALLSEIEENPGLAIPLMSPDQWRRLIRRMLYERPSERLDLAGRIHYMPALIILAFGEKDPHLKKILQVFSQGEGHELLTPDDSQKVSDWWTMGETIDSQQMSDNGTSRLQMLGRLMTDDKELYARLAADNPMSFEMIFNRELDVVQRSRESRRIDPESGAGNSKFPESSIQVPSEWDGPSQSFSMDPLLRAEKMRLTAVAFSGGGIRSATFNLGVIQKLTEKSLLPHVDYLSTVSGGGYIGSWLVSWIYRSGSISKVADRLNARKSTDPLADEVRPIRWLRMYSNYLSPNASIMSADAWTIAVTWIRNTLINQSILLLLLCTTLSIVEGVQFLWDGMADREPYNDWVVIVISIMMVAAGTLFAAIGMRTFEKALPAYRFWKYGSNTTFASLLLIWTLVAAYLLAGWMYNAAAEVHEFPHKLYVLLVAAAVSFAGTLVISFVGNYHRYKRIVARKWAVVHIFASSVLAIAVSFLLLIGVWKLFEDLRNDYHPLFEQYRLYSLGSGLDLREVHKILAYIFGIPVILEVMCVGVVIRMFIMGIYFPDEKREWWGRVGALVHRLILVWIVVNLAVLLLPAITSSLVHRLDFSTIVASLGGWAAIIGAGLRLAYNSDTAGEETNSGGSRMKEVFVRLVPYIFMIGFLLIGAATLDYFQHLNFWGIIKEVLSKIFVNKTNELNAIIDRIENSSTARFWGSILNTVILGGITLYLSQRAGVNEFTLHHFYRNRLVRAYLGATRRRTDRQKTANSFTNFDAIDDIALDAFAGPQYYGPYPLINTALNVTTIAELDRQDRKAESFLFSPLFCGFDFSATRTASLADDNVPNYAYRPTSTFAGGPTLGTAMAISGAAVNPNMGYHSSAATAFLLSVFNIKLGWWIGNPRTRKWKNPEPWFGLAYLVSDLVGKSSIKSDYVSLSDGGHFDNMGLYELVRRRCALIILSDAEEDPLSLCEGLAMAVRRCRIDLGVEIEIDTSPISNKNADTEMGRAHVVEGIIRYPGASQVGRLIYIKTALTGDEPTDIRQYKMQNPKFPQQPTSDQFFTEEQFESYRKLGYHSVE